MKRNGSSALFGWLMLVAASSLEAAAGVALCTEEIKREPGGEDAVLCLYEVARRSASPDHAVAARRLEELQAAWAESPWPALYLGYLGMAGMVNQDPKAAESLFRRTLELAARRGELRAEFLAHAAMFRLLSDTSRRGEVAAHLDAALQLASSSRDPELHSRAAILQARQAMADGEMEEAYGTLLGVQKQVLENGPIAVQRDYLGTLGNVAQQTGRFGEADESFRRLADVGAAHHDTSTEIRGLTGLLTNMSEELSEMPSAEGRNRLIGLSREVLAAARASGRPSLEVNALWLLGLLAPSPEAKVFLARCREVASTPQERSYCLGVLARRLASSDPEAAENAIHEALTLAGESRDMLAWTSAWHERMRMSWALGPDRGLRDSQAALDAIEALRDQQRGSSGQPSLFSTWADDYYWLSGRLLELGRQEDAFGVIERMRARTLTDALGLSRRSSGLPPSIHARRADLALAVAQEQRRLMGGSLSEEERTRARTRLSRLEADADRIRMQIQRADPAFSGSHRPGFASLEQVRNSLGPDEALLSFQVAPSKDLAGDFGGGSWLLASTRAGSRLYPLDGRTELRPKVKIFNGLFAARDGSEAEFSAGLYGKLLGQALAELPGGIRKLVIVPDDALHRLPFAALREKPGADPLAVRFQISLVPSATLWLRWRNEKVQMSGEPALIFADPPANNAPANERAAAFGDRASLGELPLSRDEGESILRHLGGGSLLLTRAEASEARLKSAGAEGFRIVHFATHSWTDDVEPGRSYVYLAPGSRAEDGLLQPPEIAELPLGGRMVVLSTCESAAGEILRGEGVMGLARSFFLSGAHPVVASLRKLRDDDGAALFDRFYYHIAEGKSVAAALQAAQRDLFKTGAPAAAWAGVVVLGDGDRVPMPGGRKRSLLPALITVALLLAAAAVLRRRRATVPAPPAAR